MCFTVAHYILYRFIPKKTQMYFTRRNVYYVTKKKQWAFVAIFFFGGGGVEVGVGGHTEKNPVLYRKKDIIYYIHVYEYTNLTKIEIFVSQNKIYILGNCKQSTWCPVVH